VGGIGSAGRLHHGTTVGTNAVLTRTGGRVALLVTAGFEDLLVIDRGHREDLYALAPRRPAPLVARAAVCGLDERLAADGRVVRPLDDTALSRAVDEIVALEPEAVAVCLLHAAHHPRHERRAVAALLP
jgi:N-methylhydantoinase A